VAAKGLRMKKQVKKSQYRIADSFFVGATPTSLAKEVKALLEKEREATILDKDAIRKGEDWSFLANQAL